MGLYRIADATVAALRVEGLSRRRRARPRPRAAKSEGRRDVRRDGETDLELERQSAKRAILTMKPACRSRAAISRPADSPSGSGDGGAADSAAAAAVAASVLVQQIIT